MKIDKLKFFFVIIFIVTIADISLNYFYLCDFRFSSINCQIFRFARLIFEQFTFHLIAEKSRSIFKNSQ